MARQRPQASPNESACCLQVAALTRKSGLDEGELRPCERSMRDDPIEEFLMVGTDQALNQDRVPFTRVLGPLLATPTTAPPVGPILRDPIQSVQVVAGNRRPEVGRHQKSGERAREGDFRCAPALATTWFAPYSSRGRDHIATTASDTTNRAAS